MHVSYLIPLLLLVNACAVSYVPAGADNIITAAAAAGCVQTPTDKEWFQGTADAVRQYAWLLTDTKNRGIEDVVILSGDHL
jgi:glucose-1-phosphate adenylyltransferase